MESIQCLVINLVMLPMIGPVEIICPVNEASSLAEITNQQSIICVMAARILSDLCWSTR